MKTTKISCANIQSKMSRKEMKKIVAGNSCGAACSDDAGCDAGCPRCEGASRTCVMRSEQNQT